MKTLSAEKQALLDAFQKHIDAEMRKDLETTLANKMQEIRQRLSVMKKELL